MTFAKQACMCEISETGREMGPSLKAHDLTLTEKLPKQSDLENYKKCCCTNGKCKMSQLIRLCQESPDIIINMYRISKSEDKCIPEIDLDAGQTYDSAEKLDETNGKKKYHYLMTDRSTSSVGLKGSQRQETNESVESQQSSASHPSKGILRKTVTNIDFNSIRGSPRPSVQSGGSNRTLISKREEGNSIISSTDDKAKIVIMVEPEPTVSKALVEKSSIRDSSHILSLLNMVVKQRRQSLTTQMVSDDSRIKMGRKCLNWLRCVPCVKNKKNENREHFKHEIPSVHSNPSIYTIDLSVRANEFQI